jgi:hypothetical protein
MKGLEGFIEKLVATQLKAEVWLDGSFLTEKIDPEDIDLVVCVQSTQFDNNPDKQALINWVQQGQKASHFCDSYVLVEYPDTHANHEEGVVMRAYWRGQFGFNRAEDVKGIAVVRI